MLQADGGTRTASITGGYVALAAALITYGMDRHLVAKVAAVSVGLVDGLPYLDLDYSEDSRADVDFNVVGTDAGAYVELQGTAEGRPFDRAASDRLLDLAGQRSGAAVRGAGGGRWPPSVGDAGGRLLVATRSAHKLRELRELLALERADLVSLDDAGRRRRAGRGRAPRSRRTPRSRPASALRASGLPTLADDSGLEVDALDGGPGVRTRRYAGEDATDEDNNAQAARGARRPAARAARRALRVRARPRPPRTRVGARRPASSCDGRGTCRGRIATAARGTGGFGYDPIFEPASEPPGGRTLGLWTPAEKHAISHRARAARRMTRQLAALGF